MIRQRFAFGGPFKRRLVPGGSRRLDEDDQEFIAFVREHGRLPGSGAQEPWGVFGQRLFDPYAAAVGGMRTAALRSSAANRQRSPYLNEEQMTELRARWAREDEERKRARVHSARERMQANLDARARQIELQEEERRWRHEQHRLAILPEQRRQRWKDEESEWREFARRREVKHLRQVWNDSREVRAEAKRQAVAAKEREAKERAKERAKDAALMERMKRQAQAAKAAQEAEVLQRRAYSALPSNQQLIIDARAQLERQWERHRIGIKRRQLLIPNGEQRFRFTLKRELDGLWHFRRETLCNAR
jgi:hypothetical protein